MLSGLSHQCRDIKKSDVRGVSGASFHKCMKVHRENNSITIHEIPINLLHRSTYNCLLGIRRDYMNITFFKM